jgi:hypothetical protein
MGERSEHCFRIGRNRWISVERKLCVYALVGIDFCLPLTELGLKEVEGFPGMDCRGAGGGWGLCHYN